MLITLPRQGACPLRLASERLLEALSELDEPRPVRAGAAPVHFLRVEVEVDGVSDPVHWLGHQQTYPRIYFSDLHKSLNAKRPVLGRPHLHTTWPVAVVHSHTNLVSVPDYMPVQSVPIFCASDRGQTENESAAAAVVTFPSTVTIWALRYRPHQHPP